MFDGILQTLTDVMHGLGLQRNMIFLGTLDSKSRKYTIAGGIEKPLGELYSLGMVKW